MFRKSFVVFFIISLMGCATARLPKGPDIYALESYPSNVNIAFSKVLDVRGTTKAGTIGAASIQVKEGITDLTTNYLVDVLNSRMKLNVELVKPIDSANASSVIMRHGADGAITTEITRLKMHSADAIMQPVEVSMDVRVKVYDRLGNILIDKNILGAYEKRIGISIVDKSTGELVTKVVENISHNFSKDVEILSAINKL